MKEIGGLLLCILVLGCGDDTQPTVDAGAPVSTARFHATLANSQFQTADHMRASIEMQISGEPFAQLLGFDLAGFERAGLRPDLYRDPKTFKLSLQPLAWALAIESYEYSKQPMNNLSFESGAGLSLQFGPVLNPTGVTGDPAYRALRDRFQLFAAETLSGGPPGSNYVVSPAPTDNPLNHYGWPGLWPVFAEFAAFDPTITPIPAYTNGCSLVHGNFATYGGFGGTFTGVVGNYECDYNSLNLTPRDAHVTKVLSPDALGYASWKQGIWIVNYWQTLHDIAGAQITNVDAADRAMVGQPGNRVMGYWPDPNDPTGTTLIHGSMGTYFGDIPIEGWQGLLMIEENDNKAALLLAQLLTGDGSTLGGLSVQGAIDYGYDSPLRYFPAQVAVTETPTAPDASTATRFFPKPTAFTIANGSSRLRDLSGLIGGFAEIFILTDANNSQVGGSDPCLATFDGDPFAADDGMPDGEATLHDRALGILKIALVDLDRLHFDAQNRVLVDEMGGKTVSTVELVQSILALRNAYRALNGSLQLYSNDTPDALGAPSALDTAPLSGKAYTGTLASHITALIRMQADFLAQKLTSPTGAVANGFDLAHGTTDPSPATLEAETGAIRGLLDAYLATSDSSYRQLAVQVYADLQQRFWRRDLQIFATTEGDQSMFAFTPIRFGLLSGALRQYYKLVANQPGREAEAQDLLAKLKRMYKLILNGWDDANGDDMVDYPTECTGAGLEMGERALTGEYGNPIDRGDRDADCVREISAVGLPAALGAELDLTPR